jgi:hypothetical protein
MSGQVNSNQNKSESAQNVIVLTGIENGKFKEIPLTQGKVAIVDAEDFEWLSQRKWQAEKHRNTFYARRTSYNPSKKNIKMHRLILNLKKGDAAVCDHKNRNGLDNRKENLRLVTIGLNNYNCKKYVSNTSGYRGVSWRKCLNKWSVRIDSKGITVFCGCYRNLEQAASEYDKAAILLYGANAILNFPERHKQK